MRVAESDALAEGDVDLVRKYPWLAVAEIDGDSVVESGNEGKGV